MEDWEKRLEDFYFEREKILSDQRVGIDIDDLKEFIQQELDRARKEWTEELRQAFYDTFYKSGELWFDYIFEDGDTKAEQNAKEVVEEYWKEILSKLTTK